MEKQLNSQHSCLICLQSTHRLKRNTALWSKNCKILQF